MVLNVELVLTGYLDGMGTHHARGHVHVVGRTHGAPRRRRAWRTLCERTCFIGEGRRPLPNGGAAQRRRVPAPAPHRLDRPPRLVRVLSLQSAGIGGVVGGVARFPAAVPPGEGAGVVAVDGTGWQRRSVVLVASLTHLNPTDSATLASAETRTNSPLSVVW
jgi:hypothetical protein